MGVRQGVRHHANPSAAPRVHAQNPKMALTLWPVDSGWNRPVLRLRLIVCNPASPNAI